MEELFLEKKELRWGDGDKNFGEFSNTNGTLRKVFQDKKKSSYRGGEILSQTGGSNRKLRLNQRNLITPLSWIQATTIGVVIQSVCSRKGKVGSFLLIQAPSSKLKVRFSQWPYAKYSNK